MDTQETKLVKDGNGFEPVEMQNGEVPPPAPAKPPVVTTLTEAQRRQIEYDAHEAQKKLAPDRQKGFCE